MLLFRGGDFTVYSCDCCDGAVRIPDTASFVDVEKYWIRGHGPIQFSGERYVFESPETEITPAIPSRDWNDATPVTGLDFWPDDDTGTYLTNKAVFGPPGDDSDDEC